MIYIHEAIQKYGLDNNKVLAVDINYSIQDNSDDNGPFISQWNIQDLAQPTIEQLNDLSLEVLRGIKRQELIDLISDKKQEMAYSGAVVILNNSSYIVSTSKEDVGLSVSTLISLTNNLIQSIDWKCKNLDGSYATLNLNVTSFISIFTQAGVFVEEQFYTEKQFMDELSSKTDEELTEEYITSLKSRINNWQY